MSGPTKIEWTERTWNPVRGCTRVSEGCRNCYAEGIAARFSGPGQPYEGIAEMRDGKPRWTGKLALSETALLEPLKRRKPTAYFVNSMSDLFHWGMPEEWIDLVFAVMVLCPHHTFQVLTKRPARMRDYFAALICDEGRRPYVRRPGWTAKTPRDGDRVFLLEEGQTWPLPNVWLGVSAEDQTTADARVPDLLATPAAVRFVSAEPLIGPIDFNDIPWPAERLRFPDTDDISDARSALRLIEGVRLDWIILGGESGPHARPMHPQWARDIRDQCAAAGVAFHFKQWGAFGPEGLSSERWIWRLDGTCSPDPLPNGIGRHSSPGFLVSYRVGKKRAGRLLDGVVHNAMPNMEVLFHG